MDKQTTEALLHRLFAVENAITDLSSAVCSVDYSKQLTGIANILDAMYDQQARQASALVRIAVALTKKERR